MFVRILLVLLITPILELALLIRLGGAIGFWPTVALIAATAFVGSYLLKREGLAVWRRFNERLTSGQVPGTELVDGVIILISGALLVTPGVLTDVLGLAGLLAPSRALIRGRILARVRRSVAEGMLSARFETRFDGPGDDAPAGNGWQGAGRSEPHYRRRPQAPGDSPGESRTIE